MSRSKLFLILALLMPNLTQAKNIILYDDSNSIISQGYKSINELGQSVKIDEDYEILTKENSFNSSDENAHSYSIILRKGNNLYNLDQNKIYGLNRYIISPYFSDDNFIGFVEYTGNVLRGDFYIIKKFYIFNKKAKEIAVVKLMDTSVLPNKKGQYDYNFLDQNYIKKITVDDFLNIYTINSIYVQNNPAVWRVMSKEFKPGYKVNDGFKFRLTKDNKIKCENLKGSTLECNEGFMQIHQIK
ncbi:RND transporter [Acinetobacter nosocomialis]|uniref:RND transporter n=1 Tax=Acinetobacter nosocomialis TaxID=106654 RepID=UPI000B3DA241|nr:RND transporter [Acinetobacter nosocomialis]MBD0442978.1 RND transporter [Acinetobacter nosocomialis]MDE9416055.1 RND transporter [Acinetobacter nosocomialis]MDQ9041843.1 RND transporter [Acinetobacter nosocomialis]MDR9532737.1 RND transporter [Acinetobacter nosocomialis]OUT26983.1 RND superfamily transporter [Acinetobacter nosocomialis P020]